MANCCQHDALDWFAAIAPTTAAFFAAWVAWKTARDSKELQRQLVRPLISIRQKIQPSDPALVWVVELRNDGPSAANIDAFIVVAGNEIIVPEALESPNEFWSRVLYELGVLKLHHINGNLLATPLVIGGMSQHPIFEATIIGDKSDLGAAISKLELRAKCSSAFGDLIVVKSRYNPG